MSEITLIVTVDERAARGFVDVWAATPAFTYPAVVANAIRDALAAHDDPPPAGLTERPQGAAREAAESLADQTREAAYLKGYDDATRDFAAILRPRIAAAIDDVFDRDKP